VHVNYFQRPPVHRLEIVGTGGTLRWDNADGLLTLYKMPDDFGQISSQPTSAQVEQFALPEGFDRNQLFVAQTQHFLKVVRGEAEPICTLDDGIKALKMALAAKESQAQGHPVSW
jgi:predicted dehydrogenase